MDVNLDAEGGKNENINCRTNLIQSVQDRLQGSQQNGMTEKGDFNLENKHSSRMC